MLTNDTDTDGGPKTISSVTQPANGTVALTGGTAGAHTGLTYAPDASYCNTDAGGTADTFTYTLNGGSTATVSMTVTCAPANAAPTDSGESYPTTGNTRLWVDRTVPTGQPARTSGINLLANATDPDGPETALTTVNSSGAAHGDVVLFADGSFTYTPAIGYTGSDSFTYQVSDGIGTSAPSTVNLSVSNRVWYVDNSAGVGGDGRSSSPFQTLEAADVAANASNDLIYVLYGSGVSTGYDTDVDLQQQQQLLGEGAPLIVGGVTLFDADGTKSPSINTTVNLGSGNTVRGVTFVGTRATPAIAGNAGDNGGTIMDTKILGTRPGVDLVGTTGDWTFWDVTVDITSPTGQAFLADNAGQLTFTANGLNAIRASGGAGAIKITTTVTTGTIDSVITSTGTTTTGIHIGNTGGDLTFGTVNLTTTDVALRLANADGITISGGSATSTGGTEGISVVNSTNAAITLPSGSLAGQSITAFRVSGGTGSVSYGGAIGNMADPAGGYAVQISDHDSGAIRLTGPITSNGSVSVAGGAAPVVITNTNNVISAKTLTALSVNGQFIGPDGMTFKSLSTTGAGYGIHLKDVAGGNITVTGSGTPGSGGTLNTVHLDNTAQNLELHRVAIVTGGNRGIEANNARRLVLRDSKITGAGTGIDLDASVGQHEYIFANNTIALTRVGSSNFGITLNNPIYTAPATKIWLIGNVISGTRWDGVSLGAAGTATVVGQITDNMISDYCQDGLRLVNQLGTANTDYTATGNVITDTCDDPNDSLRTGLAASSGTGSSPGTTGDDGGTMCLDARGNGLFDSGAGFPGDYLLQVVNEAKFFMPGLGSTHPGVRFVNQNSANGAPSGSVQDTADPPVGGFFTGTCETPGAPPA